ncbi:hypothetical protein [Actinomadura oligospora]|uniref:hypothetical protein n=1 Tax=Actinomadura oligospora TaxID=111804 RepID=UPI0004B85C73|nr:hypothetical protein [Actinomadura oligospora]
MADDLTRVVHERIASCLDVPEGGRPRVPLRLSPAAELRDGPPDLGDLGGSARTDK